MAVTWLLGIIIIESIILGQLRQTVNERRITYAIFTVVALLSFLLIVDSKTIQNNGIDTLKKSTSVACSIVGVFVLLTYLDYKNPSNVVGDTLRRINNNSYNLLAITLIVTTMIVFSR